MSEFLELARAQFCCVKESIAQKLFGEKNFIGETISFDTLQLRVTVVLHHLPSNTHMDFVVLIANDQAMAAAFRAPSRMVSSRSMQTPKP